MTINKEEITAMAMEQTTAAALLRINRSLNTAKSEEELLRIMAQPALAAGALGADLMRFELNQDGRPEWAELVAIWRHVGESAIPLGARFFLPDFPLSTLWLENPDEPQLMGDVSKDERADERLRALLAQSGLGAMALVPLVQAGRWVGIITFNWDAPHEFSEEEAGFFRALAGLAAPVVENRRLLAQAQMAATEAAVFKTMAENSLDAIFMINLEACFTYANRAAHELLGCDYESQEMLGLNGTSFWPEEALPLLSETILPEAINGGWSGEAPQKRKNGELFTGHATLFPIKDGKDQATHIAVIERDITEQKLAEAERERLQQEVIEAQQQAIQDLSTPIIPIMDRIIAMPLVGSIDTLRARDIMRTLLAGIREHRAKVVILDVTGVPIMDSGVVNHLNKTIQAAQLKGARAIVTGLSDAVAESIVDLGIDWSGVTTLSDLQTGLLVALNSMGIKLSQA